MKVSSMAALRHFASYPLDICTEEEVPRCRATPLMALPVRPLGHTDLSDARGQESGLPGLPPPTGEGPAGAPPPPSSASRTRRILLELKQFMAHNHPAIEVFPSDDVSFWKLLLEGPEGTPYQGGIWVLYCQLPPEYPEAPPRIRFVTPIRHCNINAHGRVCHSILDRNYTADTSVLSIMQCIYGLMLNPDYDDPLDSTLALEFYEASGTYEDSIMRHVQRHAGSRSREAVRSSLLSGEEEPGPHSCNQSHAPPALPEPSLEHSSCESDEVDFDDEDEDSDLEDEYEESVGDGSDL
eukprot:SRR837773.9722.p1 GENE.SRR837773.9722~~SRR837773.9722.p1  ORF type:complete len:323 (+),score=20.99 SRR837773.9722:82-969(+)